MVDELARGMAGNGDKWDNIFTEAITNHLFEKNPTIKDGLDLVALNIQRGRDHGIPGYNDYRELCNLGRARNFDDLSNDFLHGDEDVKNLNNNLYKHVDDVDLFVGGFLEKPQSDSILGSVFKCIVGDTFLR